MLSKFYSILIGIVIALTLVGLVFAGVTKIRQSRTAQTPETAVDTNGQTVGEAPVPAANNDSNTATPAPAQPSDLSATIKGSVVTDVKVEAPKVRDITILAKNFRFEPSEIRVKKGESVRITVKSAEGVHNLFIAGYDLRSDVKSMSESATVSLTADKTGTFDMWCEVGSHKALGMTGKLIVE